jgi:hypothetical protein
MNNSFFIFIFCFFLLSCNEVQKDDAISNKGISMVRKNSLNLDSLDSHLSDLNHNIVSSISNDTLRITVSLTKDDYVSDHYLDILKELVICNISKDISPSQNLVIVESIGNDPRDKFPFFITNEMKKNVLLVNTYKIHTDFKKYIVKNINGTKLGKLNMIIEHLINTKKISPDRAFNVYDFVLAVKGYAAYYCLPKEKNEFYKKLLIEIKKTASDKELWPDFNPNDIDYFLQYCG